MTEQLFSDDELEHHRTAPKRITNPRARWVAKPGHHEQRNFEAVSEIDDRVRFRVYQRRNLDDDQDFSCGLAVIGSGGRPLSLMRCNGANHRHGTIHFRCHVHRATAGAIAAGRKADDQAEATDRYRTLEGAFAYLVRECRIQGVPARPDEERLAIGRRRIRKRGTDAP